MRRRCVSYGIPVLALAIILGPAAGAPAAERGGNSKAGGDRAAAREARKAELARKKEARLGEAAEARKAREEKRSKARETRETKKEEVQEKHGDKREDVVDRRESRQEKRIQHGINKGYLTSDEVAKLQAQQSSIAALESSFKSDGKLERDEFRQLQGELNEASHCIWAEKHDTDGNQMSTFRLGANVFAKSELTARLADENLSRAEARALLSDFRRTVELKRTLSTGDLSADERAGMQSEYDTLLNRYFEVR